jgi:putative hydrolase of the HAD superfamily
MSALANSASGRVILWDFDQTLGIRPSTESLRPSGLRGCLLEILDLHEPGHSIGADELEPYVRAGFPWNRPEVAHPELSDAAAWWERVEPLFARVYEGVGIAPERARTLGRLARERYVDPQHWQLFDDTLPVLTDLRDRGWRHLIISNHIPELTQIVSHLGLRELVDDIINSAEIGYEKPHPQAFAHARRLAGNPPEIWMIGDDPLTDVAGAHAAGIPAIHVQRDHGTIQAPQHTEPAATPAGADCGTSYRVTTQQR